MDNLTQLIISKPNYHVFINIVDNRILMFLGKVSSEDIVTIFKFIQSKSDLIKPSFTSLLDLTHYYPLDEGVPELMKQVQEYFKTLGWGEYARVKRSETDVKLHKDMVDGFFTSTDTANVYLNQYRIEKGIN
jgi:hypothetical protein